MDRWMVQLFNDMKYRMIARYSSLFYRSEGFWKTVKNLLPFFWFLSFFWSWSFHKIDETFSSRITFIFILECTIFEIKESWEAKQSILMWAILYGSYSMAHTVWSILVRIRWKLAEVVDCVTCQFHIAPWVPFRRDHQQQRTKHCF